MSEKSAGASQPGRRLLSPGACLKKVSQGFKPVLWRGGEVCVRPGASRRADGIVDGLGWERARRLARLGFWISPWLVCVALYWPGLKAWFQQDDFAWLHLREEVHGWSDFLRLLVEPRAQGTIRPLSERLFFMVFSALFGLDALPYRIWVFMTQFANLALLSALAWRLTGSRLAGWLAAVLWISGSGLAKVMSWTSAYNQALCALFLLAAFYCLVRYLQTGLRRYAACQWAAYLLGFGANEWMVVYPGLASAYLLLCARRRWRVALPLWVPALAYVALHRWAAPPASSGIYGLYFDKYLPQTFGTYWYWAVTATYAAGLHTRLLCLLITTALAAFIAARWRHKDRLAAFLGLWFVIAIAPVVPLRKHLTEYYLTLPTLGLAMLGGYAVSRALQGRWIWKVGGLGLACAYLAVAMPATRAATAWNYYKSRAVRGMVRGVARANQLHPGKIILLVGVDSDLFWTGVFDQPFRLVGRNPVFLAPGSERDIEPRPEYGDVERFILPAGLALRALQRGELVIYAVEPDRLRNITQTYAPVARALWRASEPRQVDAGEPVYASQLGSGWYSIQGKHRWTARKATVRLGGPTSPAERLLVETFCPAERVRDGPVRVTVYADGLRLGEAMLREPNRFYSFEFALPAQLVGRPSVEIAIEVDRTIKPAGEQRELGLVFGRLAIK